MQLEGVDVSRRSDLLRSALKRNAAKRDGRFVRAFSLLVYFGTLFKAFSGKHIAPATAPNLIKEKGNPMSATAAASEDSSVTKPSKREMLDTLVKQERTVEVSSDDTLDRTRGKGSDAFRDEFEKKVNGLSGFSARQVRRTPDK